MHGVEQHILVNALRYPSASEASSACQHVHSTYLRTMPWVPVLRTCCLSVPNRLYSVLNPFSAATTSFRAAVDPGSASSMLEDWCLHLILLHHHFLMCPSIVAMD